MSIDFSLANIWHSWEAFKKGKRKTPEIETFVYYLEERLFRLHRDLNNRQYQHGPYKYFWVSDSKRRKIAVASVRDRVVHRLLYDYLLTIFDKTFVFDVWSCRKNKGLLRAIERIQNLLYRYPKGHIWRADIKKFFDNIDQNKLLAILDRRIKSQPAKWLLKEVIQNYPNRKRRGIPIGNLTSQIFANIYLNEFDRFVYHTLKPKGYVRYGDDFLILEQDLGKLLVVKNKAIDFLNHELKLRINPARDQFVRPKRGLKILGVIIFTQGRKLDRRNFGRIITRLNLTNLASYRGLIHQNASYKRAKEFDWRILERLKDDI